MKKIVLGLVAAAATLTAGAAMAQPYGYYSDRGGYGYDRGARYRDSDGDGIPNRAEWGRDRDRDGRPDQWDRYDNRRDRHWRSTTATTAGPATTGTTIATTATTGANA